MKEVNTFGDLEVRTSNAQWAVHKARQIVNKNSLQAIELTQKVVDSEIQTVMAIEENRYQEKDLWNKVKKMLLQ